MGNTKIPYCNKSWNVTVGCTHAGMKGCDNCWAKDLHDMRHKAFLKGKRVPKWQYSRLFGEIVLRPDRLNEPLHWRKPCRVFVCSMSDLFHPLVPFEFNGLVFSIISQRPEHTFLIFTKRLKRASEYIDYRMKQKIRPCIEGNFQLIVSCSTQPELDENAKILLQIPASVRGISLEPLLENIEMDWYVQKSCQKCGYTKSMYGKKHVFYLPNKGFGECGEIKSGIDWIIVGCESGKNRRPCNIEWVRKIVHDCRTAGVAVYVKQIDIGGKVVTDINKFPEDLRIRQIPEKP